MSSSIHSRTSLSPSNSQQNPTIADDIPLEDLVSHLLAAKRSLVSINTVWRANEIVTSARSALEESVILSSRTTFVRRGISQQTKLLKRVRSGIETVYKDGQQEFEDVLRSLDAADSRLQQTMDVLRCTIVESAFRPENEEPRTLLDFVDEAGVETMRSSLKASIDQSQEAQAEFLGTIQKYDSDVKTFKAAIKSGSLAENEASSPIPHLLHSLETNASEMASLLTSLVSHFDLCVTAIKHTEGGLTAVRNAVANPSDPSQPTTLSGVIGTSPTSSTSGLDMTPEERIQMLTVLSNDAAEVEDVVAEINSRLASMEEDDHAVNDYVSTLTNSYNSSIHAFNLLDNIGSKLPLYIAASQSFISKWSDHRSTLDHQMSELNSMSHFYNGYLSSYDGLILEVARRRAAEEKIKNVLRKAMETVRKLHEADRNERDEFRADVGEFLPLDLWHGLRFDAPRWDVGLSDSMERELADAGMDDCAVESTPELSGAVVDQARERIKANAEE